MRWSSIIKKNQEENENKEAAVFNYAPKEFNFGTPEAALEYLNQKKHGSDFVMSDVLRETTGVDEIERLSEEQKIEQKVLERIAEVQEEAYQKAYQLGFEEGTKKAIEEKTAELVEKSEKISDLINSFNSIKQEMIRQNEAHVIRMIYQIASRLAFDHVTENQEVILKIIKQALEDAQADENVNVLVSTKQIEFLEKIKLEEKRENDFLKKVKFISSDTVSEGSCIVETNYGVIDARIEERIAKLWNEFKQAMPKVKSPIEPE